MNTNAPNVQPALVTMDDGKPYAPAFGDIYATRSGAFGQACEVFLGAGAVAERWAGKRRFTILENGFGLGTNFMATLKAWRGDRNRSERLDYMALECFPVSSDELVRFAAPEVVDIARELAAQWPVRLPGFHRISLDQGRVTLTLVFADSETIAPKLSLAYDALYLDGFAPSKNPRMWSERLLRSLGRYAKTGATVTTWCTAGAVRRALERSGFEVQRLKGFGAKRERLLGVMRGQRKSLEHKVDDVLVIGGGLSGANVAFELACQGVNVRMIDEAPVPGARASALAWGILHPHYARDDNLLSRFSREGFEATRSRLKLLESLTGETLFAPLGCVQMAHTDKTEAEWQEANANNLPFAMPADYAQFLTQKEASSIAGVPVARGGWYFPQAGMVRVGAYCRALVAASEATYRGNTRVASIRKTDRGWAAIGDFGEVMDEASHVVVACARDTARLLAPYQTMAIDALKGRITLLRDTDLTELKMPVSGEGYIVHMDDGFCGVGATYELPGKGAWSEERAHLENLEKLTLITGQAPEVVVTGAYCEERAVGAGRLPIVGAVADEAAWLAIARDNVSRIDYDKGVTIEGLWVMAAMGSRGVSLSALSSQILASEMLGLPAPIDHSVVKGIHARRLMKRRLEEFFRAPLSDFSS